MISWEEVEMEEEEEEEFCLPQAGSGRLLA